LKNERQDRQLDANPESKMERGAATFNLSINDNADPKFVIPRIETELAILKMFMTLIEFKREALRQDNSFPTNVAPKVDIFSLARVCYPFTENNFSHITKFRIDMLLPS
jgi:hypothetical protein